MPTTTCKLCGSLDARHRYVPPKDYFIECPHCKQAWCFEPVSPTMTYLILYPSRKRIGCYQTRPDDTVAWRPITRKIEVVAPMA